MSESPMPPASPAPDGSDQLASAPLGPPPNGHWEADGPGATAATDRGFESPGQPSQAPTLPNLGSVWHYAYNNRRLGPFTWAQFQQLASAGQVTPETMVWRQGAQQWTFASEVPGLFPNADAPAAPRTPATLARRPEPTRQAPALAGKHVPGLALPSVPGYELLSELGHGSIGVVYKARQLAADRLVALKMIQTMAQANQQALLRFQVEALALSRLQHPNLVQLHEVGMHEGRPFLAMEFVEGSSLQSKLTGKPGPVRQSAQLVEKLARAVHAAHLAGIVHRDLRPANVLVTPDWSLKITDFGLVRHLAGDSGQSVATASYLAPEQALARLGEVGPATDIHALGALLYELLTGRPPFRGSSTLETLNLVAESPPLPPSQLNSHVPRDLELICLKCLEKDPSRRYASAAKLAEDFHRFLEHQPVELPAAAPAPAATPGSPMPTFVLFVLAAATAAVGGFLYLDYQRARQIEPTPPADEVVAQKPSLEKKDPEDKQLLQLQQRAQTHALAKVAVLWQHDPARAREVLENRDVFPPKLHDPLWQFYYKLCTLSPEHPVRSPVRHGVTCVADAPGPQLLAAGFGDGTVTIWDLVTGATRTFDGHMGPVQSLALTPDGRTLAMVVKDGSRIQIWDVAGGKPRQTIEQPGVCCLALMADGTTVATAREVPQPKTKMPQVVLTLWDVATGKPVADLPPYPGRATALAFSSDGKVLASGGASARSAGRLSGEVRMWVVRTRSALTTVDELKDAVSAMAFTADRSVLMVALGQEMLVQQLPVPPLPALAAQAAPVFSQR